MNNANKPAMPQCDWCGSVKTEQVGIEYSGTPIVVCKDCGHEFYDFRSEVREEAVFDIHTEARKLLKTIFKD